MKSSNQQSSKEHSILENLKYEEKPIKKANQDLTEKLKKKFREDGCIGKSSKIALITNKKIDHNEILENDISTKNEDVSSIKSNLSVNDRTTNFGTIYFNENKNNNLSEFKNNYYSDFDSKIVLNEFNDYNPFSFGNKFTNFDEKMKEKLMYLKTGTKIKTKLNIDSEKIKNWKFQQKLQESKLYVYFSYNMLII